MFGLPVWSSKIFLAINPNIPAILLDSIVIVTENWLWCLYDASSWGDASQYIAVYLKFLLPKPPISSWI